MASSALDMWWKWSANPRLKLNNLFPELFHTYQLQLKLHGLRNVFHLAGKRSKTSLYDACHTRLAATEIYAAHHRRISELEFDHRNRTIFSYSIMLGGAVP